ncbi:claudin-1 [Triplophysa rosa]|uniref:Claudin-1-like n=1 Tax=Triplophysa rosa TaxID=992332 RepID=A0A9W7W8I9_TRIRA|nr:claudin-1 [Triplophysa rosa]KAI7791372.1 putative claudin-1-like [Triplophysa rosa]
MAVQLLGYILSIVGLCGLIFATFTNEWKVSVHDNKDMVLMDFSEGLWMECSTHVSSPQFMCNSYTSILYQSVKLQVAEAMMIISIGLAGVGVLVAVAGLKCTRCLDGDNRLKNRVALTGGSFFILSGLCALIVTSWFIYEIMTDFYAKESNEQRYVVGRSLIAGFVAALLCLFGGMLLSICSATRMQSSSNVIKHPTSKSPGKDYV